jgi:peptide/nickel transport system permease protein
MVSYIFRRVLATLPVMAIVALFVFSLLYIAPGDPAAVIAGDQASPADVERIRQGLGLDRPFLVQFGSWLWHISAPRFLPTCRSPRSLLSGSSRRCR